MSYARAGLIRPQSRTSSRLFKCHHVFKSKVLAGRDAFRPSDFVTRALRFLSEEKRAIHAGNCDRDEFNRQEHAAHDGFRGWRRKDEIHAEKFRQLRRWGLPWREQDGQNQRDDHPVEHREIELIWRRGSLVLRRR